MTTTTTYPHATIEADPSVPLIRITRDFSATPAQLMAAHTDPVLFARWVGPDGMGAAVGVGMHVTVASGVTSRRATARRTRSGVAFIRSPTRASFRRSLRGNA